jgi:predicted branched-subunit amino acid permease
MTKGLIDGLPIAFGYLAVSFAFGLYAANGGMAPLTAAFLSITNLTSAGQFAGTSLIFQQAPWFEIALTVLLINIRYLLMSLSLSQKIRAGTGPLKRLLISYGVTDEIYAVAISQPGEISASYMAGLIGLPVAGWTLGTLLGAAAGQILPDSLNSALGIALYAMFVAIVIPPARRSRPIRLVVGLAALLSLAGTYAPYASSIPSGWRLIACTTIAALAGAWLAPVESALVGGEEAHHG